MNLRILTLLGLSFGLFSLNASADYSGILYEQGSKKEKVLYKLESTSTMADGKETIKNVYKDNEGNVVIEQMVVVEGSKLVRDELTQHQTNQKGLIEIKDGKAFFTKEVDGKSTTKEEKLKDTFVVAATFQKFVKENWEAVSGGKEIEFRYGVWDRQETVGFEIFKTGTEKIGEQDVVVLKMKPSSFIISALVKPIIFKFAADGSHLVEMNGRAAPKRKDGSSWKDLDAEIVYSYK